MKTLIKLVIVLAVIGVAVFGYFFWTGMTPGERYHLVDKARSGDVEGLADSVKYKAEEELERQKRKAAEKASDAIKEVGDQLVDETAKRIKEGTDEAAEDAKQKIRDKADQELGIKKPAEGATTASK